MAEDAENQEAEESAENTEESRSRWKLPVLVWALLASMALHLGPLVPLLMMRIQPEAPEFDMEWADELRDMRGIGHGQSKGRWAELEEMPVPEDEPEDKPEPEEKPEPTEEPEPEPEEKPEPEEEPEPEEKPEPEPEEKPEPDEQPEPQPTPSPVESEERAPLAENKKKKQEPDEDASENYFAEQEKMPGVDRGGPNEIPNLRNYGPGNTRMTGLVRVSKIRGTPYEDGIRKLLENQPDFRILAHSTGFDPIEDMNSFFMASANPQYLQQTFIAVRHEKTDPDMKSLLDSRFQTKADWETHAGRPMRALVPPEGRYQDPRKILLAKQGLAVVTRPEWLPMLTSDLSSDSPLVASDEGADSAEQAEVPQASLIGGLEQIERTAERDDTIVLLSGERLYYIVPGYGQLRNVEVAKLMVTNPESPTLDIDLKFRTEDEAEKFVRACPRIKGEIKRQIGFAGRMLKINELLDRLTCRTDGVYANVHAVFTPEQIARVSRQAQMFMPSPPALQGLPPAPEKMPDQPSVDADAGDGATTPDAGGPPNPDADQTGPAPDGE
ncbi:MAG: hypothetical protein ACQEVA_19435 [Myxococcota bacterium]